MRDDEGEIVFEGTGDELIDKWEKELAMGLTPDLTEGMSQEAKKRLEKEKTRSKQASEAIKELDGLVDSDLLNKFQSVTPGSKQYQELSDRHKAKSNVDLKKFLIGRS